MRKKSRSRTNHQRLIKLILAIVLITAVAGAAFYFFLLPRLTSVKQVAILPDGSFGWKFPVALLPDAGSDTRIAYSDIRDPGGVPQGLPVRLKIPSIGVNSAIEDALITPDGRMDVPAGTVNVAWFALGPHPGKEGSAVIGGHFGIDNGVPRVFFNLDKLKAGDKVYIEDDSGNTLAFIVRRIQLFDRNADATTVFTSGDGLAHLNLITCEGVWNKVNDTYPDRRVVFTDAIPNEGTVTVSAKLPTTATTPKVTPTGKPTPEVTSAPAPTPTEEVSPTPSAEFAPSPTPIQDSAIVKTLYGTRVDGIISSILLLSILSVALMIIRG